MVTDERGSTLREEEIEDHYKIFTGSTVRRRSRKEKRKKEKTEPESMTEKDEVLQPQGFQRRGSGKERRVTSKENSVE